MFSDFSTDAIDVQSDVEFLMITRTRTVGLWYFCDVQSRYRPIWCLDQYGVLPYMDFKILQIAMCYVQ